MTLELVTNQTQHGFREFADLQGKGVEVGDEPVIESSQEIKAKELDFELIQDTYFLMAYCYWRLNNLNKSIWYLNTAKWFIGWEHTIPKEPRRLTNAQINHEFRNLMQKEIKVDILESVVVYKPLRSRSLPIYLLEGMMSKLAFDESDR